MLFASKWVIFWPMDLRELFHLPSQLVVVVLQQIRSPFCLVQLCPHLFLACICLMPGRQLSLFRFCKIAQSLHSFVTNLQFISSLSPSSPFDCLLRPLCSTSWFSWICSPNSVSIRVVRLSSVSIRRLWASNRRAISWYPIR